MSCCSFPPVDIHDTMLRTPCTKENWRDVIVDVDSEAYTVIFGSVTTASFASSSRVLGSSGIQRSGNWVHFPNCNFNGVIVFWKQYGLLGLHGKMGIYSEAFHIRLRQILLDGISWFGLLPPHWIGGP